MILHWYLFDCSAWRTGGDKVTELPAEVTAAADMGEDTFVLGEKSYFSLGRK